MPAPAIPVTKPAWGSGEAEVQVFFGNHAEGAPQGQPQLIPRPGAFLQLLFAQGRIQTPIQL